jgi:hypothetical protein
MPFDWRMRPPRCLRLTCLTRSWTIVSDSSTSEKGAAPQVNERRPADARPRSPGFGIGRLIWQEIQLPAVRPRVNTMLKTLTRSRLIQVWFAAITLIVVAGIAFGMSVTLSTGVLLLALSLVPPAIVLLMWPGVQPPTASEVLRGTDRRDW